MTFLQNYQIAAKAVDEGDDFAKIAYEELVKAHDESYEETPMMRVTIVARLSNTTAGAVVREQIGWPVPASFLEDVAILADHYLANYETLHFLAREDETVTRRVVVPAANITVLEVVGELMEKPNEDEARRARFRLQSPDPTTQGSPTGRLRPDMTARDLL